MAPTVDALLESFDQGLLEAEWEAVAVEYPLVADLIRQLVGAGVKPKEISRRTVAIIGTTRTGMAKRLENAAHYWANLLKSQQEGQGVAIQRIK